MLLEEELAEVEFNIGEEQVGLNLIRECTPIQRVDDKELPSPKGISAVNNIQLLPFYSARDEEEDGLLQA